MCLVNSKGDLLGIEECYPFRMLLGRCSGRQGS